MNGALFTMSGVALVTMLTGCHKEPLTTASEAGAAAVTPVPAPNSSLAHLLGTADAGRGFYSFLDEGPACGPIPAVDRDAGLGDTASGMQFFETRGMRPEEPTAGNDSPLELEVRIPTTVNEARDFTVLTTLTNHGKTNFIYQRAMDGSDVHWVSPFVDVYLRAETTKKTYLWSHGKGFGRCGNTDPRHAADFITLGPGMKREKPLGEWAQQQLDLEIDAPGTYLLWVVYTACASPSRGPSDGEALIPEGVFQGTIASNGVRLTVNATR